MGKMEKLNLGFITFINNFLKILSLSISMPFFQFQMAPLENTHCDKSPYFCLHKSMVDLIGEFLHKMAI